MPSLVVVGADTRLAPTRTVTFNYRSNGLMRNRKILREPLCFVLQPFTFRSFALVNFQHALFTLLNDHKVRTPRVSPQIIISLHAFVTRSDYFGKK